MGRDHCKAWREFQFCRTTCCRELHIVRFWLEPGKFERCSRARASPRYLFARARLEAGGRQRSAYLSDRQLVCLAVSSSRISSSLARKLGAEGCAYVLLFIGRSCAEPFCHWLETAANDSSPSPLDP